MPEPRAEPGQAGKRGCHSPTGRSPAARDADCEHDGERLHHLDCRGQEGGGYQQDTVHGFLVSARLVAYTSTMDATVATATDSLERRIEQPAARLAPAELRVAELLADLGPEAP